MRVQKLKIADIQWLNIWNKNDPIKGLIIDYTCFFYYRITFL